MTADEAYANLIYRVYEKGLASTPRGMLTLEILNDTINIDMNYPIISSGTRMLNYKFMAAEACWILSGRNDVEYIERYCGKIAKFSDDGLFFYGAYGPKVVDQMGHVIQALRTDPYSRQAVINIWREKPAGTKDVPCTLSLQFFIRLGKLHMIANMRSSDVWLGVPYDIFNFSCIANFLRLCMGNLDLGVLYMNAGSRHLYHSNIESCKQVFKNFNSIRPPHYPASFARDNGESVCLPSQFITRLQTVADGEAEIWNV